MAKNSPRLKSDIRASEGVFVGQVTLLKIYGIELVSMIPANKQLTNRGSFIPKLETSMSMPVPNPIAIAITRIEFKTPK